MTTHANYAGDLHHLLEERLEDAKRLWSSLPRESRDRLFHEGAWIAHCEVRAMREQFGTKSAANDLYDLGFALREAAERTKRDYVRATGSPDDAEDDQVFHDGRLHGYFEVLAVMQSQAEVFGIPLEDLALDGLDPEHDLT